MLNSKALATSRNRLDHRRKELSKGGAVHQRVAEGAFRIKLTTLQLDLAESGERQRLQGLLWRETEGLYQRRLEKTANGEVLYT